MPNEFSPASDAENEPSSPPNWETIARVFAGESSAEEASVVRRWLADHPEDRALVDQLDSVISKYATAFDGGLDVDGHLDTEGALARVHRRIEETSAADVVRLNALRVQSRRPRYVAFGIAALAAAAALTFVLVRSGRPRATALPAAARTIATAVGQRDSVVLADGSRVMLGPDSRLVVPADYGVRSRAVELYGSGYFDVRHDAAKPFAVRAPNAVIEDIGTTFTVQSDANATTAVAVLSGSVRLRANESAPASGAVLNAGDRGTLTPGGEVRAYPHTVAPDDSAWTTGKLVFRDASIAEVAGELRRWYGVELHVADSALLARHLNASFDGDSIDQVLKVIGLTLDARMDRRGDDVTMYVNHGSATMR